MPGEQSLLSCSANLDCPPRFICYTTPDQSEGGECHCNQGMLFTGPACKNISEISVLTFLFAAFIMGRCAHHSFWVFWMHFQKWKREEHLHSLGRALGRLPLPLLAAFWVYSASLCFFACSILNVFRLFTFAYEYEDLIFTRLIPALLSTATLLWTLAGTVTGFLWWEIALKQRQITTGRGMNGTMTPSLRFYRLYCLFFSSAFLTAFIIMNISGGNGVAISMMVISAGLSAVVLCFVGASLIQKELKRILQTCNQSSSSRRLLGLKTLFSNIRSAAYKTLSHSVLIFLCFGVFNAFQTLPHGKVPAILVHLLLIFLYMNIYLALYATGEYLAGVKVRSVLLTWWRQLVNQMISWLSWVDEEGLIDMNRSNDTKSKVKVVPIEGEEVKAGRMTPHPLCAAVATGQNHHQRVGRGMLHHQVVRSILGFPSIPAASMKDNSFSPSFYEYADGERKQKEGREEKDDWVVDSHQKSPFQKVKNSGISTQDVAPFEVASYASKSSMVGDRCC